MLKSLELYKNEVRPSLQKEFGYKNLHQIPKIEKVVLNMGLGEAVQNPKVLELAIDQLSLIASQKAVKSKARKSIAAFKLREGMPIGCYVSLRSQRMWDFIDRFLTVSLPRMRDFRGLSPNSFDGRGNYNLGIKEQLIFPEIDFDSIDKIRGLNISIITSSNSDQEARSLLKGIGFPFRK